MATLEQNRQGTGSSLSSLAFNSTPTSGNLLVLVVMITGNGATSAVPTGWTEVASSGTSTTGADQHVAIYYRVSDGTESAAISFAPASGGSRQCRLMEWSTPSGWGADPLVDDSTATRTIVDTDVDLPALTATGSEGCAVFGFAPSGGTTNNSVTGSWVRFDSSARTAGYLASISSGSNATTVSWSTARLCRVVGALFEADSGVEGTATGTSSTSSSATGTVVPTVSGTASGSSSTSGSATGVASSEPVGTGTSSTAGSAVGESFSVVDGDAVATSSTTGTATATSFGEVDGTASGTSSTEGSATGEQPDPPDPAASIADLVLVMPYVLHGIPIGWLDWRLSVEVAFPTGVDYDEDPETWTDVTPALVGMSIERGAHEPFGRARIGKLTVDLETTLNPEWSPTRRPTDDAGLLGPDLLIRVGLRSPSLDPVEWLPQFTGLVDSWTETRQVDTYRVRVEAFETLSTVANLITAPVPAEGDGDHLGERVARVLDPSVWPYGQLDDFPTDPGSGTFYDLEATTISQARLAECYLAADSTGKIVRSHKDGRVICHDQGRWWGSSVEPDLDMWPMWNYSDSPRSENAPGFVLSETGGFDTGSGGPANGETWYAGYDRDSLVVSNDRSYMVNDVTLDGPDLSSPQQRVYQESIDRYGRRTFSRSDIICKGIGCAQGVARFMAEDRGETAFRVEALTVHTSERTAYEWAMMATIDYGVEVRVWGVGFLAGEFNRRIDGYVRGYRHDVLVLFPGRIRWTTTLSVDGLGSTVPMGSVTGETP